MAEVPALLLVWDLGRGDESSDLRGEGKHEGQIIIQNRRILLDFAVGQQ